MTVSATTADGRARVLADANQWPNSTRWTRRMAPTEPWNVSGGKKLSACSFEMRERRTVRHNKGHQPTADRNHGIPAPVSGFVPAAFTCRPWSDADTAPSSATKDGGRLSSAQVPVRSRPLP